VRRGTYAPRSYLHKKRRNQYWLRRGFQVTAFAVRISDYSRASGVPAARDLPASPLAAAPAEPGNETGWQPPLTAIGRRVAGQGATPAVRRAGVDEYRAAAARAATAHSPGITDGA